MPKKNPATPEPARPEYVIRYRGVDLAEPLLKSDIDAFEAVEAALAQAPVDEGEVVEEVSAPVAREPDVDPEAERLENARVQAERIAFKEEQERIAAAQRAEADAQPV